MRLEVIETTLNAYAGALRGHPIVIQPMVEAREIISAARDYARHMARGGHLTRTQALMVHEKLVEETSRMFHEVSMQGPEYLNCVETAFSAAHGLRSVRVTERH
jgi:1,4-dihydroxy-2-naphthoyl-CoA synthase